MTFLLLVIVATLCGAAATALAWRIRPPSATAAARRAGAAVRERRGRLRHRPDPDVATGVALTAALLLIAASGVLVGVLALLVRTNSGVVGLDRSVARWAGEHRTGASAWCLEAVTHLGAPAVVIAMAVVLAVAETVRTRSAWVVPFLLVVVAGNGVVTTTVKGLMDRVRPEFNPIAETLGPSFPSGHSSWAAAFGAAAALLLTRGRGPRTRAAITGAAAALVVLVAGSRVLLSVHWLSDVLAGVALGGAWFCACAIAFGGRVLRFGAAAEAAEAEAARRPARVPG